MVLSIQAKKTDSGGWEALYDNGREHSGKDVFEWIARGVALGAGEILLTSVDCDGMMRGMDYELINKACEIVNVPIIASGGVKDANDIVKAASMGVSAVAVGSALHFNKADVQNLKEDVVRKGGTLRIL